MRLKSSIWVAAYIRRCQVEGLFAAVRRHGADEAGAIFVKVNRLDGTADLYGPAPQAAFDETQPADRAFSLCLKVQPRSEEHTSELQSLAYLVCRLLLEKKKKKKYIINNEKKKKKKKKKK